MRRVLWGFGGIRKSVHALLAVIAALQVGSPIAGVAPSATVVRAVAGHGSTVGSMWSAPEHRVLVGVSTPPGPNDLTALGAFEHAAGRRVAVYSFYQGWASGGFDGAAMSAIAARGAIPMVTWEPWDYTKGVDQPAYRLARIAAGAFDGEIRGWATAAKRYGGRILLRFAHEMNASGYPWCEGVNGNAAGSYVRAWRHVHDVFDAVGADNVGWVWAPNVAYAGTTPLRELYPGDRYVDWVALDGYNGGTALPWGGWLPFDRIFGQSIRELRVLAPHKPIMISEVASAEEGGSKAAWIRGFFASLAKEPAVRAFVWFDWNKETDWRIQSSSAAERAFAAGVADPRYGT